MKALTINDRCVNNTCIMPKVGEIITVAGVCSVYPNSYDIIEYPVDKNGTPQSISQDCFAPISDIDEMELLHNRQTELA